VLTPFLQQLRYLAQSGIVVEYPPLADSPRDANQSIDDVRTSQHEETIRIGASNVEVLSHGIDYPAF
jgi:hypothetical protein